MTGSPIRTRLVGALLLLLALSAVATSAGTTFLLHVVMTERLDRQITDEATRMLANMPPAEFRTAPEDVSRILSTQVETGTVVTIIAGQEVVVSWRVSAPGVVEPVPEAAHPGMVAIAVGAPPRSVDLGPFGNHRMVAIFSPYGDRVALGLPERPVESTIGALLIIQLLIGGAALIGAALIGVATIRRTLRPLADMAVTATKVSELPLDQGEVPLVERVPGLDVVTGTEVDQVGAALNHMLDHVEAALRARQISEEHLRRFLDDAGHEMRTPLSTIRGYAELSIAHHGMSPEAERSMTRIQVQADRMTGLVEDLLLLARLGSGRPVERRRVDLTRLVIDAVDDAIAAGPDHYWHLDLPAVPVTTSGDESRLGQVLTNLLGNARRHTPPGTSVTVSLAEDEAGVYLGVVDDGPGIDPELLPSVFRRFVRGSGPGNQAEGSSGLGLSIVDAIVVAHGGTVEVRSHPGRTRFTVHLPRPTRTESPRHARPTAPARRRDPRTPRVLARRAGSEA